MKHILRKKFVGMALWFVNAAITAVENKEF